MQKDKEIFESLIAGGLIGATLGALITNNKNGSTLGALAGAVIMASLKASENALKTKIPLLMEEGDALYEIQPGGAKKFIKSIPKNTRQLPRNFTLE